jgi:anthranilate synthase component 1
MLVEPSAEEFAARYDRGEPQVVWTTLVADLETPVSAFLKIASGKPISFLLESVEGGAVRGRYSIIGLEPDLIVRADGKSAEINRQAATDPKAFTPLAQHRSKPCATSLPRAALHCPMPCRRWQPEYSAISVTTWCG